MKIRKRPSRLLTRARTGKYKNVISVAKIYRSYLERDDVLGYRQVAEHFGVTKATISYYLKFLTLPADFVNWLGKESHPVVLAHFGMKVLRNTAALDKALQSDHLISEAEKVRAELFKIKEPVDVIDGLIAILSCDSVGVKNLRVIDLD